MFGIVNNKAFTVSAINVTSQELQDTSFREEEKIWYVDLK